MTLSPTVAEWVAAYELEHGHRPDKLVLEIAEHLAKVGEKLRQVGRNDASGGYKARHNKEFQIMVCKAFHIEPTKDPEFVETIADLWQSYYTDGFNAGEGST